MREILSKIFFLFMLLIIIFHTSSALSIVQQTVSNNSNPFYVDPSTQDFSENPDLLARILSTPHGYFRFINIPYSQYVCKKFQNWVDGMPSLNLHGDAHIEQYAITDLGRGLTDYDDSSSGPGIIDWMRFGVSLHLVCYQNGWQKDVHQLFDKFLNGYRDALKNPEIIAPEPIVVKRIRSGFTIDREKYFKWIDSIMEPMPVSEQESLMVAIQPYIESMFAQDPNLNEHYFDIVKVGYLKMGIGSALDLKFVVRIHGESDDPMDDVVLEFKQVRNLSGIECINTIQKSDPFRILLGQARIAYQPFHHLGYFQFRSLNFWVHSWVDNYKEIEIGKTVTKVAELEEIVYDIGVQLGKGHVKHIAAPFGLQLRREQLQILNKYENEIKKACHDFTKLIIEAWNLFRENLNSTEYK